VAQTQLAANPPLKLFNERFRAARHVASTTDAKRFNRIAGYSFAEPLRPILDIRKGDCIDLFFYDWISPNPAMSRGTRPGVVFRPRNKARPNRIELDVADGIAKVVAVERRRKITALPKMAFQFLHSVHPLRILAMHGFHCTVQAA
jgi:hypothetical protein